MEVKFYECAHCKQIIAKVKDKGVPVICCGEKMQEIILKLLADYDRNRRRAYER